MARIYATSADYETYTGQTADDDTERLLARASAMLDGRVFRALRYRVDDNGLPTDSLVTAAFRDAVCAQVEWWEETGDALEATSRAGMVRIGAVQLGSGATAEARAAAGGRTIADAVWEILQSPDLTPDILGTGVWS